MGSMDTYSPEVKQLLVANPNLVPSENNNRIKCLFTGHEMPCNASAIKQYLDGKKYKQMTKNMERNFQYSDYTPMIVPSNKKGHELHLFCTLTLRHLNKTPSHVLRHVKGRRYKKAKERWDACQKDGTKFVPTPFLNKSKHEPELEIGTGDDSNDVVSDVDSLSDLYPVGDFGELSLEDDAEVADEEESKGKKKRTAKSAGLSQNKKSKAMNPPTKKKKRKTNLTVFT